MKEKTHIFYIKYCYSSHNYFDKIILDPIQIMGMSRPKGYSRKMEGSSLPAPWIPCVAFGCTGTILG